MSALEILDQVPEFARCVAAELKRLQEPQSDKISTNEAYRRYGRSWIKRLTEQKMLTTRMDGNRRVYSVSEIERVRAKEEVAARALQAK